MPIGFPAYAEKSTRFRGVPRKTLLRAAEDTLEELRWHPRSEGKWSLLGSVPMGFHVIFFTWGARFRIDIEEGRLFLRSEGILPLEWLDLGQHDRNINRFLDCFEDLLESDA